MNANKQTREYIALGVLLVILGITIVFFLQGNKPQQPANAKTQQAKKATPAASKTTVNSSGWVAQEQARIPSLVAEVQSGRNPFKDLMAPASAPKPAPAPTGGQSAPIPPGGELYGRQPSGFSDGPLQVDIERTVKLKWITWQDAAAALKRENITDVTVTPGKQPGTARLQGPEVSVLDALDNIIARLDVEPPAPDFQLRGVITTTSANMAVISVDGKTYSLYQGETIPGVGWTVKTVTPTSVTLTKKGYTSVTRRLAGGKA